MKFLKVAENTRRHLAALMSVARVRTTLRASALRGYATTTSGSSPSEGVPLTWPEYLSLRKSRRLAGMMYVFVFAKCVRLGAHKEVRSAPPARQRLQVWRADWRTSATQKQIPPN